MMLRELKARQSGRFRRIFYERVIGNFELA